MAAAAERVDTARATIPTMRRENVRSILVWRGPFRLSGLTGRLLTCLRRV